MTFCMFSKALGRPGCHKRLGECMASSVDFDQITPNSLTFFNNFMA